MYYTISGILICTTQLSEKQTSEDKQTVYYCVNKEVPEIMMRKIINTICTLLGNVNLLTTYHIFMVLLVLRTIRYEDLTIYQPVM